MKENLFSPFGLIFIGIFSLSSIPFSILLYFLRKFLPIKAPQANGIYGGLQCNPNEANMVTISNSTMIFYGSTHIHSYKWTWNVFSIVLVPTNLFLLQLHHWPRYRYRCNQWNTCTGGCVIFWHEPDCCVLCAMVQLCNACALHVRACLDQCVHVNVCVLMRSITMYVLYLSRNMMLLSKSQCLIHTHTHCDPSSSQIRIKKLIAFSSWDIEYYHVDSLGFGSTQLKSRLSFSLSVSFGPHSFGIYKSCSQHFQFHLNEWTFYHSLYFSHIQIPFSLYLFASLLFWENVSCNRNTWTVSKRDWLWNGEFYGSFYAYRTSLAKSFNCFSSV